MVEMCACMQILVLANSSKDYYGRRKTPKLGKNETPKGERYAKQIELLAGFYPGFMLWEGVPNFKGRVKLILFRRFCENISGILP